LHKKHAEFEAFEEVKKYDIIYFDAFCPATQPHLWEEIQMKKCYDLLLKDGILVTFSAKGSFKRALRSLGFEVERLPGPPGKREMTRATKI
jgi:tRNA U34 5-methylaminomethyl-2-thiouridine-forming methyltransferase MnmC